MRETFARLLAFLAALALAVPLAARAADPPTYIGAPATPNAVGAPDPPRQPYMAPNARSNIHDDAYMTDTYQGMGPLGRSPTVTVLSGVNAALCGSVTFDSKGRIVSVCVGLLQVTLTLRDPHTLAVLASYALPPRPQALTNPFQSFGGGGYFYLDNHDRAVVPTANGHLMVIAETDGPGWRKVHDYDLSETLGSNDSIISALPDWHGLVWYASKTGVIGTVNLSTGAVKAIPRGEAIGNSFAVDESGGVYIVTDKAMYRFDAAPDGTPTVTWREVYPNIGTVKSGQTEHGSGTTPTLMGRGYVSITDNDDPMDVVVYRRAANVSGSRLVCVQPVFGRGASSTDNSLIGTARSMIVENNYGYSGPSAVELGHSTTPGIDRVDIDRNGRGCHIVWRSNVRAPTVVPKLSLDAGLVYTYTKPPRSDLQNPWYLTALDFRTGRTVFSVLAGDDIGFNNNYAPVTLGPDGTAYVGVLNGLIAIRDATPPQPAAPRLALRLGRSAGRSCAARTAIARIAGSDTGSIAQAVFGAGGRRFARATAGPFRVAIPRRFVSAHRATAVSARIALYDGRRLTLDGSLAPCR